MDPGRVDSFGERDGSCTCVRARAPLARLARYMSMCMCTCGVRAPDRRSPPLPRPLPLPHPPPLPPPLPTPLPKQRSVPSSLPRPPCVPGAPSPGASSVVSQRGARAFLERRARPRSLAPVCGQERRAHGREAARERQHKRGRERAKGSTRERERGLSHEVLVQAPPFVLDLVEQRAR